MKVKDIAVAVGLPADATAAQVYSRIFQITEDHAPAEELIVKAAREKVAASAGKLDMIAAIAAVTREQPALLSRYREETRPSAQASRWDRLTPDAKAAAEATVAARTEKLARRTSSR